MLVVDQSPDNGGVSDHSDDGDDQHEAVVVGVEDEDELAGAAAVQRHGMVLGAARRAPVDGISEPTSHRSRPARHVVVRDATRRRLAAGQVVTSRRRRQVLFHHLALVKRSRPSNTVGRLCLCAFHAVGTQSKTRTAHNLRIANSSMKIRPTQGRSYIFFVRLVSPG